MFSIGALVVDIKQLLQPQANQFLLEIIVTFTKDLASKRVMKLLTTAMLLILFIQLSHCAYLKVPKRDRVIESVLRNLIIEHKLKGFLLINLIRRERSSDILAKSKELMREASSLSTVTQIHFSKNWNMQKYGRNMTRYLKKSSFAVVAAHVVASESTFMLILADSHGLSQRRRGLTEIIQSL